MNKVSNKPAIVAIAYNRVDSISRLLSSLSKAVYPEGEEITLVISIDKSDSDGVLKAAEAFAWEHGEKVIIAREERMGLKKHVLACGDLSRTYGSIIVLEDDLYVAPSFYEYAVKALDFTEGDAKIGGISLYNHLFNVHARRSFAAIDDGFDNWYFQFASSWGQAYTMNQWNGFMEWMDKHGEESIVRADVPKNVSGWSDKSWLKYYITYLIDTDKYFLYPRISYTTNFGDIGSHAVKADSDLQVPLAGSRHNVKADFSKLEESKAVYDAFFENKCLSEDGEDILVDLYGIKPIDEIISLSSSIRYVLTSQRLAYKAVKTYGMMMRPVDANVIYETDGDDYCLYDIREADTVKPARDGAETYLYEYRGISAKQMLGILKYRVNEKIKKK